MSHRSSPARAYDFLLKFLLVGDSDVGKGEILASLQDGATESPYGYNMGEWGSRVSCPVISVEAADTESSIRSLTSCSLKL